MTTLREAARDPARAENALATLAVGGGLRLLTAWVPVLPLVVVVLGGTTWGLVGRGGGEPTAVVVALGGTAALAFAAPFCCLFPAGLAAYAVDGRVGAAFDRRRLRAAAGDGRYPVATLASAGALGVTAALYRPLNAAALGFFVAFYAESAVAALLGRAAGGAW